MSGSEKHCHVDDCAARVYSEVVTHGMVWWSGLTHPHSHLHPHFVQSVRLGPGPVELLYQGFAEGSHCALDARTLEQGLGFKYVCLNVSLDQAKSSDLSPVIHIQL